jgi:hypothetical protein
MGEAVPTPEENVVPENGETENMVFERSLGFGIYIGLLFHYCP